MVRIHNIVSAITQVAGAALVAKAVISSNVEAAAITTTLYSTSTSLKPSVSTSWKCGIELGPYCLFQIPVYQTTAVGVPVTYAYTTETLAPTTSNVGPAVALATLYSTSTSLKTSIYTSYKCEVPFGPLCFYAVPVPQTTTIGVPVTYAYTTQTLTIAATSTSSTVSSSSAQLSPSTALTSAPLASSTKSSATQAVSPVSSLKSSSPVATSSVLSSSSAPAVPSSSSSLVVLSSSKLSLPSSSTSSLIAQSSQSIAASSSVLSSSSSAAVVQFPTSAQASSSQTSSSTAVVQLPSSTIVRPSTIALSSSSSIAFVQSSSSSAVFSSAVASFSASVFGSSSLGTSSSTVESSQATSTQSIFVPTDVLSSFTTLTTSSPSTSAISQPACGLHGWGPTTNIGYYLDTDLTTYTGCLGLCESTESCLSFAIDPSGPVCIIYDMVVEGNVRVDPDSPYIYFEKDGSCAPTAVTTTTITSSSTTSSAALPTQTGATPSCPAGIVPFIYGTNTGTYTPCDSNPYSTCARDVDGSAYCNTCGSCYNSIPCTSDSDCTGTLGAGYACITGSDCPPTINGHSNGATDSPVCLYMLAGGSAFGCYGADSN